MRGFIVGLVLTSSMASSQSMDFKKVLAAFESSETQRLSYTYSIHSALTLSGTSARKAYPPAIRVVKEIENAICLSDAYWTDGNMPLHPGKGITVREKCLKIDEEFTGVKVTEMLHLEGFRPMPGSVGKNKESLSSSQFSYSGSHFANPYSRMAATNNRCLENSTIVVDVDSASSHPKRIVMTAGQGCSPQGNRSDSIFGPGSIIDVEYRQIDNVWQLYRLTETHRLNTGRHEYVGEFEFVYRVFQVDRALQPTHATVVKTCFNFVRPKKGVLVKLNPHIPPIEEKVISTVSPNP